MELAHVLIAIACTAAAACPACLQPSANSAADSAPGSALASDAASEEVAEAPAIPDASPEDASPDQLALEASADQGPAEASPEADPYCHYDCFGWAECVNGLATRYMHTPVKCEHWTGKCPIAEVYPCERGCRIDMTQSFEPAMSARQMCEEFRPKQVGDPCTDESYCEPQVATWDSEGKVTNTYLQCDIDAGTCIAKEPPQVADWLAECGLAGDGEPGFAFGVVVTDACSGGLCMFVESAACVLQGCTISCDSDDDCPPGAVCEAEVHSYCKPGPPNQMGVDLNCPTP
jgi:hypothetical protein